MIQIFSDGACEPVNPNGIATYGFVIYKDNERIAEGSGVITDKSSSNNVVEYTATIKAFSRLLKKFYTELSGESIILNSDSQLLINQLTGSCKVSAERILPLYAKLKRLIKKIINYRWYNDNNRNTPIAQKLKRRFVSGGVKGKSCDEIIPKLMK